MMGERIRLARAAASLSLRALAERVGVSAQAISKYERDLMVPSSGVLLKLADALGVRVEFFFRRRQVGLHTPSFRKKSRLPKKKRRAVISQAQEWLERYLEVEDLVLGHTCKAVGEELHSLRRRVSSLEEAEACAAHIRRQWDVGTDAIENLTELLEDRSIKVGSVDAPDGFDACMFDAEGSAPVIVANRNMPGDRQRLSLAHELGHAVLEPVGELDAEKAAFRFAGAFLVPDEAARQELGTTRRRLSIHELHLLKHKYGMSMQAWIYRAKDLEIISASTAKQLFQTFRKRGWHRKEPGDPVPHENPQRLQRLVWRAVAEGGISQSRAEELFGGHLPSIGEEVRGADGEGAGHLGC